PSRLLSPGEGWQSSDRMLPSVWQQLATTGELISPGDIRTSPSDL
ncbi:hypothetical protein A2U01_0083380, partial [Trifolium medium]|nr:hypothetical protein [Trifolium medium]